MRSRREFIQLASVSAMLLAAKSWSSVAAKQKLSIEDLLDFDTKGQVTLLHLTDLHGQLKPIYFRPPSENFGVGKYEGIPPHLVGEAFLKHFNISPGTPLAYAHTMVDYVPLAMEYGKLGGLDHTATLINKIRSDRGEDKVLLLDGGDTWQGSYTSLKTQGEDMVELMKAIGTEAMVGHWEFTFGQQQLKKLIKEMGYPFLGGNVFDTEWDEPVFESTKFFEKGGVSVAVIGQHFPYTPIANPSYMVKGWSFGIRPEIIQKNVNNARKKGAEVVVLLSHNGFDVDKKMAGRVSGIDVILSGHTHDALPEPVLIGKTIIIASGSNGKFVSRVDLDVQNGRMMGYKHKLIPIFSDVISPDKAVANLINQQRAPYINELNEVIEKSESLLYRRGNFNGTWDDLICEALIEEREADISMSPGVRWGPSIVPGQDITREDIWNVTSMTYGKVYRTEFTGEFINIILEDVADNLFNADPYYQQGGDMVRIGGMSYKIDINKSQGSRITDMTLLKTGEKIDPSKTYIVSGWASVNENTEGPQIWDVVENYIRRNQTISIEPSSNVKVVGI